MRSRSSVAEKRKRYRREYLQAIGRPSLVTGPEVVAAQRRIRSFRARGMSYAQMQAQTGVSSKTMAESLNRAAMLRRTVVAVGRMVFEEPDAHAYLDETGTRRRVAALWADGFSLQWIADRLEAYSKPQLQKTIRGTASGLVRASSAADVARLYRELEGRTPEDEGIPARSAAYARGFAGKKNLAPRHCWDPDTIDDPEAHPEWTGACGTRQGVYIHHRDRIPMCVRCAERRIPDGVPRLRPGALGRFREAAGLSLSELGGRLDLHTSTVYYWETGRSAPKSREIIEALAGVLDVAVEELSEER